MSTESIMTDTSKSPIDIVERFVLGDKAFHWMMTAAERTAVRFLAETLSPKCTVEVGTAQGGSLNVFAEHSERVYSLDIDPSVVEKLGDRFSNVEFVTGDSQKTLPELLHKLIAEDNYPELILIDGAHSYEGAKADISNVLKIPPTRPTVMIMHDSFNPGCRQGILEAGWEECPYAHHLNVDYVPGHLNREQSMWCGLALAILKPEPRSGALTIIDKQPTFDAALARSTHQGWRKLLAKIAYRLKRK